MPRAPVSLVYVGIKSSVIAFNRKTGAEVWRTPLPAKHKSSASFVNVVRDAEGIFATCAGEIFALDPKNGSVVWHDGLKKMGTGLVTIATDLGASSAPLALAASHHQAQMAASTAAMTAATI